MRFALEDQIVVKFSRESAGQFRASKSNLCILLPMALGTLPWFRNYLNHWGADFRKCFLAIVPGNPSRRG